MNLKIRRSQQSGMTGTVSFKLRAIVDLDPDERAALHTYKFGKQIVYETPKAEASRQSVRSAYTVRGQVIRFRTYSRYALFETMIHLD